MKTLALFLAVALFTLASAQAGSLKGVTAFYTGAFACDGANRWSEWYNDTGSPIYIRNVMPWMGADKGAVADFSIHLKRLSDGSQIMAMGWDHYNDPTAPTSFSFPIAPDYFDLGPGDALQLIWLCNSISIPTPSAAASIIIWYTETQPK